MSVSGAAPGLVESVKPVLSHKWPSRLFESFCRTFLRKYCRLVVSGAPPQDEAPFMVCCNHASHIDSIAIMVAAGVPFSACALLAARDYFFNSPLAVRITASFLSLIPINRFGIRGFRDTLQLCRRHITCGGRVIIAFPEGTRGDGRKLRPFKRGPGILSAALCLRVVPVWIAGTHDIMPKGHFFPRRGTLLVAFGDALQPPDLNETTAHKMQSVVMMAEIAHAVEALARSHGCGAASAKISG
jgi:1-acyl-sn-glycerol-3-phosphate acyltransferase